MYRSSDAVPNKWKPLGALPWSVVLVRRDNPPLWSGPRPRYTFLAAERRACAAAAAQRHYVMLHKPKSIPPEPYYSAALYLLYQVALFIRNNANVIGQQQLSDLGDAIHNVPESLTEYGHYFDEQKIREMYLAAYDEKWAKSPEDFSLLRTLDAGLQRAQQWQSGA